MPKFAHARRGIASLRLLTAAALAMAAPLARPAAAQTADPFAAGVRWNFAASPSDPWIPASVEFAAGGEWLAASAAVGVPRWFLFSSAARTPLASAAAASGTLSGMELRAGDQPDELFALSQLPDPDASHRKCVVARLEPATLTARWSHDMGVRVNAAARLHVARDGQRLVAVAHDGANQRLRLDWLDGAGVLQGRIEMPAGTLRQTSADARAERVAVVVGPELWVIAAGGVLHHEVLATPTQAMALSGDGTTLLIGAPGQMRVLGWSGLAFVERSREVASAAEVPVRCAISDDGATWAAGWWNASTARDLRLEVRGAPGDQPRFTHLQSAPAAAMQNYPSSVVITADGRRAAFGVWGSLDPQPEALLVDCASGATLASLDLPGSALSVAVDPSGTRLAIAAKHSHANQFATTGGIALFDSGERDFQSLGPARWGMPLTLAARHPGARSVLFLVGTRATQPRPWNAVGGILWLSRANLAVWRVPTDASGRADLTWTLPAAATASGLAFSAQALFRLSGSAQISTYLLEPAGL